jgi:hypothetical protein
MRALIPFLMVACTPPAATPVDSDPDTDPSTPITTADTAPPVPTADTAPDLPIFDCTVPPPFPTDPVNLDAPRARHGIAFDAFGNLVGENGSSLIKADGPSSTSILAANTGQLEQMDYLPSGELVIAKLGNGNIVGVMPDGQTRVIATNVNAYGVHVGPDGFIYTANQDRVHRIDPVSGERAVYVDLPAGATPKVINFSPTFDKFYVGTNSNNGRVYEVALDANLEQIGGAAEVRILAQNVGQSWHDGLGVDVCGNLYVNEYWSRGLYRVRPDGTVQTLTIFPNSEYGHGMAWGSGVGPWPADAIFVPQPYNNNRVKQATLGLPSRQFNGGAYITLF